MKGYHFYLFILLRWDWLVLDICCSSTTDQKKYDLILFDCWNDIPSSTRCFNTDYKVCSTHVWRCVWGQICSRPSSWSPWAWCWRRPPRTGSWRSPRSCLRPCPDTWGCPGATCRHRSACVGFPERHMLIQGKDKVRLNICPWIRSLSKYKQSWLIKHW